ncbi:helix-turn-helix transcriptional regulator [Bacillus sp. MMSF_3328]|uniref:helix-turn-helix transcriptional regulator n=1 Tax=Bacillus sp. MMSF_3328 TaxID=3047080 RepID=UPI00273D9EB8|nr:helix-turn-helix transcriptional regulator [Bacillus sp. MMSF_3328]
MKRNWLIKLRKSKKLKQADIAGQIPINRGYYSQIELGVRNPSEPISKAIGRILNFDPSLLLFDSSAFKEAFSQTGSLLAHSDLDLRYTWIYSPNHQQKADNLIGLRDDESDFWPNSSNLIKLKEEVINLKSSSLVIMNIDCNEEIHTYLFLGYPLIDSCRDLFGVGLMVMRIYDTQSD